LKHFLGLGLGVGFMGVNLGFAHASPPRTYECQVAYQGAGGKTVGSEKKRATTSGSADQLDLRLSDERFAYHFEIVAQTFQIDVTDRTLEQDASIKGGSAPYIAYQFPLRWTPSRGVARGLPLRSIEFYCAQVEK
jgi:hypothetical protein